MEHLKCHLVCIDICVGRPIELGKSDRTYSKGDQSGFVLVGCPHADVGAQVLGIRASGWLGAMPPPASSHCLAWDAAGPDKNMGSHKFFLDAGSGINAGIFQSVLTNRNGDNSTALRREWSHGKRILKSLKSYNISILMDSFIHIFHLVSKYLLSASSMLRKGNRGAGNTDEQDTVIVLKGLTAHWRRHTSTRGSIQKCGRCPECFPQEGGMNGCTQECGGAEFPSRTCSHLHVFPEESWRRAFHIMRRMWECEKNACHVGKQGLEASLSLDLL